MAPSLPSDSPSSPDRAPTPAHVPAKSLNSWRLIFRVVRWTTYLGALITLILVLHTTPPPAVQISPQAAQRVEEKIDRVQQAVTSGQPATLRMDQTELNSYLASHLDIGSIMAAPRADLPFTAPGGVPNMPVYSGSAEKSGNSGASVTPSASTPDLPDLSGTSAQQLDEIRSSVKDVKVELIGDRARAYVVFDFHGKDMTLQLEGKLGASDGYLRFEPVSGQIGSLPIPQSTLETAVQRMMDSPENREKLKLPADISGLKIENGEVVATYK